MSEEKKTKIFISHSSDDAILARMLSTYLRNIFSMNEREVFCSSNFSIPGAAHSSDVIRKALLEADEHIFLITNSFLNSTFCLFEWGASWALNKPAHCFYQHPISYHDRRIPIYYSEIQSVKIGYDDKQGILAFLKIIIDNIVAKTAPDEINIEVFLEERAELVNFLKNYRPVGNIDIKGASTFHNPDGTNRKTLIINDSFEEPDALRLDADFYIDNPNFVGCVIPLTGSWQQYFNKKLSFKLRANKSILGVTLELKGKDRSIISRKQIDTSRPLPAYSYKLSEMNSDMSKFSEMTELVFLLNKNDVDGIGTIIISSIELID